MSFSESVRSTMKLYMLKKIREDDPRFIRKTAENFQISDTSVRRYIRECMNVQVISENPHTKCGFALTQTQQHFSWQRDQALYEEQLYQQILPHLSSLNQNAENILAYIFMEIMNNAIEHAQAQNIQCHLLQDSLYTELSIVDDGTGIFRVITDYLNEHGGMNAGFEDAILELYKGKFTTQPEHHSGEGIFFSSRLADSFSILSEDCIFAVREERSNALVQSHLLAYYTDFYRIGTAVAFQIANHTEREPKAVFDEYANVEDGFIKTRIPLAEACPYGKPISRSQARRILYRLDQFRSVELDFSNIDFIGQGFADEIFRVFKNQHPEVEIIPVHAEPFIEQMIRHVR